MSVPDKLINFRAYNSGNNMIGVADVSLPEFTYMSEAIKGAGIAGEVDSPVMGHFQSLSITINWRSLIEENISFAAPKTYQFTFMGSVQSYDQGSGEYSSNPVKVVVKCVPKKFAPGNFTAASEMGVSGEFEVSYIKISINNKEKIEVDKFNFICIIDGVDYLAKVRKDMGM